MPGLDLFNFDKETIVNNSTNGNYTDGTNTPEEIEAPVLAPEAPLTPGKYYNPRLDPRNFLEGPLSLNPATRLRQMLARPGIVVCTYDAETSCSAT